MYNKKRKREIDLAMGKMPSAKSAAKADLRGAKSASSNSLSGTKDASSPLKGVSGTGASELKGIKSDGGYKGEMSDIEKKKKRVEEMRKMLKKLK